MPGETTHFKIKYAQAADETKAFPAEVNQPQAEKIDEVLYEGNKVAAGQVYTGTVTRIAGTEYEPSATRSVEVKVIIYVEEGKNLENGVLTVGTAVAGEAQAAAMTGGATAGVGAIVTLSAIVTAGKKWKFTGTHLHGLSSTYLPL